MSSSIYKKISPKTNTIFRGDNLEIMRAMPEELIDLCYIDPPFFTQRNYKNIWGDKESVLDWDNSQLDGFFDTKDFFERHVHNGEKGLTAYLSWMRVRLIEIHRLLKPNGSFYLHLDYHAYHYMKVILDEIFGYKNFKNEIIWKRKNSGGGASNGNPRNYANALDVILYYVKGKGYTYNQQYTPLDEEYAKKTFKYEDPDGRRYESNSLSKPEYDPNYCYTFKGYEPPPTGWRYPKAKMHELDKQGLILYPTKKTGRLRRKRYLDESKGIPITNLWSDIGCLQRGSKEKTKWPTQKPLALLERIILSSSNEGDVVFDCFAGCGTSMHAAQNLKRKWIGIDISPTAMKVNKDRLEDFGAKVKIIDEKELPVYANQKKAA